MRNVVIGGLLLLAMIPACAEETVHTALIGDIASIEGVRDNPVLGYGLVVGFTLTFPAQLVTHICLIFVLSTRLCSTLCLILCRQEQ